MSDPARAIQRVLWTTLLLNVAVATAKMLYAWKSGMLSMAADGVHSFLDGSSNVIGLVGVAAAYQPPDDEHPYGHRKFETFAALGIGAMLLLASYEILKAAWHRLRHDIEVDVGVGGYVLMGAAMVVSIGVSIYEDRAGRRLGSEVLRADSAHARSDVLTSLSVIVALAAASKGWTWIDVLATLFIVAWIAALAWQVAKPSLAVLADEARIDPQRIDELAMSVDGVRDVHRIRTRGHFDAVFLDLHVQVDPSTRVDDAHAIAHRVETTLKAALPEVVDVITHLEPHGDPVEGLDGEIIGPPRETST